MILEVNGISLTEVNASEITQLDSLGSNDYSDFDSKMPGVRCRRCAERGVETWVLSGKRCPRCNHQC